MRSTPNDLRAYAKAYKLKIEMEDAQAYRQGIYNLRAFEVVMSHFAAGMSGKKSNAEYYEAPLLSICEWGLTQEEADEKELRKMLLYEEMWHKQHIKNGLKDPVIL